MRAPPPGSFSATMVPPSALTTWATMARPRPDPGRPRAAGRAVEAVEDVGQVLVGDAGAVVVHHDRRRRGTRPTPARRAGSTCGRCRAGCRRPGAGGRRWPSTQQGSASRSKRTSLARPWVFCTATASCTSRSRRSGSRGAGSWSPRASSARSPTRSVSSCSCTSTSSTRTERSSALSSSTRRITSRLVRRLVSGVRSSWEASSTSWLWARRDDSSASSRRLKVRRRRPSSSGPPGREPARDVGRLGQVLDGVGERVERDQRGAGHQPAEDDGEQDADEGHDAEQQRQLLQLRARR